MLRNVFYWILINIVIGITVIGCFSNPDLKPYETKDLTDSTKINNPDSTDSIPSKIDSIPVIVDPVKPAIDSSQFSFTDSILAASTRFGTKNIYQEASLENVNGIYSTSNDYTGKSADLDFSLFAPSNDTLKKRPFILFVHEGAFLFGSLNNETGKARSLAQKGYVTAAINYRLGFNGASEGNSCGSNRQGVIRAIYRSVQDTYAALHYFIGKADAFGIDTTQVFLAGSSAGGIAISALAYMQEADFEALDKGIVMALGSLDPYKTAKKYKLRALLTSLGYAVLSTDYITRANAKPTLFFQRSGDNVLAYQQGQLFFCSNYPNTSGAKATSVQLGNLRVPYELNYEPLVGHLLSYPEEYIVGRYAQFVQRLWKKDRRQIVNEKYKVISDVVIN